MNKKALLLELLVIVIISVFLSVLDVRVCPVYHIFKHPCPGCGLTRSFKYLFKGDIVMSLKYNILGLPLVIAFVIMLILMILKKDDIVWNLLNRFKVIVICLAIILTIVVEIINLNNPLLY